MALAQTAATVAAQPLLGVSKPVWDQLSGAERESVQKRFVVQVFDPETFGVVVDAQAVNESTPGSSAGTILGSSLGEAAYIDRAISNQKYSAKSQLGAALLGGLLGSALDTPAVRRFHQRYAVKFANGNVKYFDTVNSDPFRHAVGVCVTVPEISLAADQSLCTATAATFRSTYLPGGSITTSASTPLKPAAGSAEAGEPARTLGDHQQQQGTNASSVPTSGLILCKLATLAPVRSTAEKCAAIKGEVVYE